jgi:hypothetical protein
LVEGLILEQIVMRMPVFAYFLVMGMILFGGLALASGQLESKPLAVSQRIGVPTPFKAPPAANGSLADVVDPATTTR